jgi:hypothetical protein
VLSNAGSTYLTARMQDGFIKAFSDHVDAFLKGFAHAQRLMRNLYVSRLMIYPRYAAKRTHTAGNVSKRLAMLAGARAGFTRPSISALASTRRRPWSSAFDLQTCVTHCKDPVLPWR